MRRFQRKRERRRRRGRGNLLARRTIDRGVSDKSALKMGPDFSGRGGQEVVLFWGQRRAAANFSNRLLLVKDFFLLKSVGKRGKVSKCELCALKDAYRIRRGQTSFS